MKLAPSLCKNILIAGIALGLASSVNAVSLPDAKCGMPPPPADFPHGMEFNGGYFPPPGGPHMAPLELRAGHPFLRGIKLTEEQEDKIFVIENAVEPLLRQHARQLGKLVEEQRVLSMSDQYEDSKIRQLAEASARVMVEMSLLQARSTHDIYGVLTAEQRAQLEAQKSADAGYH